MFYYKTKTRLLRRGKIIFTDDQLQAGQGTEFF